MRLTICKITASSCTGINVSNTTVWIDTVTENIDLCCTWKNIKNSWGKSQWNIEIYFTGKSVGSQWTAHRWVQMTARGRSFPTFEIYFRTMVFFTTALHTGMQPFHSSELEVSQKESKRQKSEAGKLISKIGKKQRLNKKGNRFLIMLWAIAKPTKTPA